MKKQVSAADRVLYCSPSVFGFQSSVDTGSMYGYVEYLYQWLVITYSPRDGGTRTVSDSDWRAPRAYLGYRAGRVAFECGQDCPPADDVRMLRCR